MALVRSPILPPGFYWIDLIGPAKAMQFAAWRAANAALVKVRSSREHSGDRDPVHRTWVLFEVLIPVVFPAATLGFASVAPKGAATTEDDTVEAPDAPKDATDQLAEGLNAKRLVEGAVAFSWVFGLALGLIGLSKLKKS